MNHQRRRQALRQGETRSATVMARGLGWFSLAMGVAGIVGAKGIARWLGMERDEGLIKACGVREIVTGIGILAARDPAPWIWGRTAGDAMDLAILGKGLSDPGSERDRVMMAMGAVAGVTLLDAACAGGLSGPFAHAADRARRWDYSDRSGLPRPAREMRGAARDFDVPRDMRIPDALRAYEQPRMTGRPRPPL